MSKPVYLVTLLFLILISIPLTLWLIRSYFSMMVPKEPAVLNVYELKFNSYLKEFNKTYSSEEYNPRFENFKASLREIARLNALEGKTVFGLTKFSDMSKQEFAERMLLNPGLIADSCTPRYKECTRMKNVNASMFRYGNHSEKIPSRFDWREKGDVGPVLNQRLCLGCWAFSIIGVMESMAAIRGIDHESLSIQELLDCSSYTKSCRGGSVIRALDYICLNDLDIVAEKEYPLTLIDEEICKLPAKYSGRKLQMYNFQCYVDEDEILRQIALHGPLIAAVDARNWINYMGGIIRRACSRNNKNHVVQIVGYDRNGSDSEGIPYYIVKNSFGEDFGDHGYVKIEFNNDVCGIADQITLIDVA